MPEPVVLSRRSPSGRVMIVQLNRPDALNALSPTVFAELNAHLAEASRDNSIACIVITGGEKVFAAGADIKAMEGKDFTAQFLADSFSRPWDSLSNLRKPVIAAVAGYAFGGGFELALMCDLMIVTPSTRLALPEVNLGIIPGAGGTQRLPRLIGKARAMDVVLNSRRITGQEAVEWGVATAITKPGESVVDAAVAMGDKMAEKSAVALMVAKEAVNGAFDLPLQQGLTFERRLCHALFSSPDQIEGMNAFIQKRKPRWPSRL